ncbi:kinase domain protein (macronuclear) [Tetrahymena thermophila SB210]|uniref:Kinase domain protein n=1 Tax=Tetrahymena thermophila (strain SB210) TaxID=312017 RepID=Q22MQ7_TETTS|nr:kinase domain protein [Tetrahymena thermophila SB210]EAR86670.1 kinase domain protein [Tetrahymena thermophila SB210]|eukprot:XP_976963.1 kinase domain protein [Tetrahymena thermophila SB210]
MSYNNYDRVPANPKRQQDITEEDDKFNRNIQRETPCKESEDEKYIILESQIAGDSAQKTYKCQMNENNERIGFVKVYNKNKLELYSNGKLVIQRARHSIDILQNFSRQSANWIPQLLNHQEDDDNIEIITEYVQDNINEMIEQKQIYSENDAIYLMKCILMSLNEMHNIKNVFNAEECYLNIAIHPKFLLFKQQNGLLSDAKKDIILFSNAGDLFQEEDLKKKNTKEIEQLIKINEYIAPETLKHKKITQQSNLWSVGCIFYEMLFNEKFMEINAEKASTKEGLSEYYQQVKYSSETLRSTLICKSTTISNFSITCLLGLLAFHEKDRYNWEQVKKNIFSLDLTKSIDEYDTKGTNHSYVSNNNTWANRKLANENYQKRQAFNTSNVYMSFTDNSVILDQHYEQMSNSIYQKSQNKSQLKQSAISNTNSQFNASQNIRTIKNEEDFLKQSFMNGVMKKSLIKANPRNENSYIEYMKKDQKDETVKSQINDNQVLNIISSFSHNGVQANCNNLAQFSQLNHNNSFTEDVFYEDDENLNVAADKSITKSVIKQSNFLGKSDLNKSNLSYTNSNKTISYNFSCNTNNQQISKDGNSKVNKNNESLLQKSSASNKSGIYKYQLQMPKYSELQQEEVQKNKTQDQQVNKSQHLENNSNISDNKSLFKHIEQHKLNQQKKFCPLLDQYDSSHKSDSNAVESSGDFTGFDFLDKLMAQRDAFNPDIDLNSNRSDVSSNPSNLKQIPLANPRNEVKNANDLNSNIETQKIQQNNQQALSIHDLSHSPYNKNTVKMSQNNLHKSGSLDISSKTLQMKNPNGTKSKVVSESKNDQSICKSENNKNPQIVYSVVPTPSQSQINIQITAAGTNKQFLSVQNEEQQQFKNASANKQREEGGGMQEVYSRFINASDLKIKLQHMQQNNCDENGQFLFDQEPIEGFDDSQSENGLKTPQQKEKIFDELVSQDEIACSYMLNTKMRNRMGLNLSHLQRAFSDQPQYQAYGEAYQEISGNQSFTSAVGYEKSVYYDQKNQMLVQKERKSSLVRSQTVSVANPPIQLLKDTILKDQYKPFNQNEELFVFSSFLDPFEFKIQSYFQIVLQKTEEIFKHFNNEECLNCVLVVLSLFRVRLYNLIFRQLTEQAKKNCDDSNKQQTDQKSQDYFQLTQSIKQEMKEKITSDKNIKKLDQLIMQFLKRSTLEKGRDLIEPHIYGIYRKHLFAFYNFLNKKIYDSQSEAKKELKLPYDKLIQMSRLGYHILILSHYQKVFKLYFKELFTQQENSSISNLYQFIEEKIAYMDLFQLQKEKNNIKSFLNIKQHNQISQALPQSSSPLNKHKTCRPPAQPINKNKMEQVNKQSILI